MITLAASCNCLWLWRFPAFHALPVAPALTVPLLLAGPGRPVSFLRLPARPFPRRFPALFAAIALARLPRMKALPRILSADNTASAADGAIASADPLDFRDDL